MKKLIIALYFLTLTAFASDVEVYFAPDDKCQQALIDHINSAKDEILVQAYSFTAEPVAVALIDAKKRGCNVMVIIDKTVFDASVYPQLKKYKIKVFEDSKHPLAHAKIMIFDKKIVACGSYNFSGQANKNSEDLNFITDDVIAKKYITNFDLHLAHSEAK